MQVKAFIIENRVKGYYIGHMHSGTNGKITPRWRWSIPASHSDVYRFDTEQAAKWHISRKGDFPEGTYIKEILVDERRR